MFKITIFLFGVAAGLYWIYIFIKKTFNEHLKEKENEVNIALINSDNLHKDQKKIFENKINNIVSKYYLNECFSNLNKTIIELEKIKEEIKSLDNDIEENFELEIENYVKKNEEKYKPKKKKNFNYKELEAKGKNYEIFVGKYFENLGYKVFYNGIMKGRKDEGIDLIAEKENEILLIQCKNWKENSKYKIKDKNLKEFIGNCFLYIEKRPEILNKKIKRIYVTSNDIYDKSAIKFLEENKNLIKKMILKY